MELGISENPLSMNKLLRLKFSWINKKTQKCSILSNSTCTNEVLVLSAAMSKKKKLLILNVRYQEKESLSITSLSKVHYVDCIA